MTSILWVAAGYCACVIFPMPVVSRAVLDAWAKLGAWVKSKA